MVRTLAPGTLRIGTYFVNPPFEYVSDGQRIGFEVDLMNEIARRLALTPVFVDTEWETILQQMQAGQYDAIVGGITLTPERERTLAREKMAETALHAKKLSASLPSNRELLSKVRRYGLQKV